eukprot:s451_g10.t1
MRQGPSSGEPLCLLHLSINISGCIFLGSSSPAEHDGSEMTSISDKWRELCVDFVEIQSKFRKCKEAQPMQHPAQQEDGALLHCLKVLDILSDAQSPHDPGGAPAALTSQLRLPLESE